MSQLDGAVTRTSAGIERRVPLAAWYSLAVLLLLYTFSTIDRAIINMMVQPLERDLHLSDLQIGLLQGPAFGLFYASCGLPMGYLVDRFSRRWIGAIGVSTWGLATCVCGLAGSVTTIFVGRMGVGLGESALTPTAHAIIPEQFPPQRLSTALSIYMLGAVLGGGIAAALSGAIVQLVADTPRIVLPVLGAVRSWQLPFLAVGGVTVLLAPLMLSVHDGRRRELPMRRAATASQADTRFFRRQWKLAFGLPLAFGLTNVLCIAFSSWIPTFMIRSFGWNPAQIGIALGAILFFGGGTGQMLSAAIVDRLYARGTVDAHIRYHLYSLCLSIPCAIAAFLCGNPFLFLVLIAVFFFATFPCLGYAAAALQLFAPSGERGRVAAVLLAIMTVVGLAFGPTIPALLTDHVFMDKAQLGKSLVVTILIVTPPLVLMMLQVARTIRVETAKRRLPARGELNAI